MVIFTVAIAMIYVVFFFLDDLTFDIWYVFGFLGFLLLLLVVRKKLVSSSELILVVFLCMGIILVLNVQKDDVDTKKVYAYMFVGYTYGCFTVLIHKYIINFSLFIWFYIVFISARTAAMGVLDPAMFITALVFDAFTIMTRFFSEKEER